MTVRQVAGSGVWWLSAAADDPLDCRAGWRSNPGLPMLLRTGRHFDAVVVTERLGLETFDRLRRHRLPLGPVLADHAAGKVGFLLPSWGPSFFVDRLGGHSDHAPAHRYLGLDSFIVVPGPDPQSGGRYEWLNVPPRGLKMTARWVAMLAAALRAAEEGIVLADTYGDATVEHVCPTGAEGLTATRDVVEVGNAR